MEQMNMHIAAVLLIVLIMMIIFCMIIFRLYNDYQKELVAIEKKNSVDYGAFIPIGKPVFSDKLNCRVVAIKVGGRIYQCGKCSYYDRKKHTCICKSVQCEALFREDECNVVFRSIEQYEKYKSTPIELQN